MKNKMKFDGFKPLMLAVHKSETKLVAKLKAHRAKHAKMGAAEYVEAWVLFGITIPKDEDGNVYTERWLKDIARAAGVQQRKSGAGPKPKTDAEKRKAEFERWLAKMPKRLSASEAKAVVKKATASC
jgi:hypothetical protein